MPGNGFRKAALAVAIGTICGGTASSAVADIIVIKGSQTYATDIAGTLGDPAIFSLQKSGTIFTTCNNSSKACTFTNTANINLGGALSVFTVGSGAYYKVENSGEVNAEGGTYIASGSAAGKSLSVTNTGTINSDTAIDYQVPGGRLILRLADGSLTGDISIDDDPDLDYMIFSGGSYSGTARKIDIVRATKNTSSITGVLNFASVGTETTRKLEVYSGASLYTTDLEVNNASLILQEDANLSLEVSDTNTDTTDTTGIAVIRLNSNTANVSNGEVTVIPAKDIFRDTDSKTFKLIQGVDSDGAANVVSVSPLFNLVSKSVTSNLLEATVSTNTTPPEDVIRNGGGSENGSKAYGQASNSSNTKLYRATASRAGIANSVEFAEELAPTTNGGAIALAQDAQDLSHQNIVKRLNSVSTGSGVNAGSVLEGKTLWAQGLYGEGKQDDRRRSDGSTLRGYTSRITGFTMGMDMELGRDLMAGAAVTIGQGSVNKNKVRDNTEMDTYMATLYGRWYIDPASETNLDLFLNYGLHKNRRERFFDVENNILNQATSDFDSRQYGIKAVLTRTMMFDDWAITPLLGVHYGRFDIDDHREKGSVAALEMEKQRYEIIEAGVGVGISRTFHYRNTEIVPEVKVSGWHDFSHEGVEVQTRFVTGGDSFLAKGIDPEKTTWTASAGVTFVEDEHFEMTTGYERNWRKGFHSDNVYVRAEYKF